MQVAALLTGKGKSTLADKNILPIKGRPLVYYPAKAARDSKLIQRYYTSSDSEDILQIAYDLGYEKIRRPDELCLAESKHVDAITHAVDVMRKTDGYKPDILIVLLANNVTVKTEWIDQGIQYILDDNRISAVVPVYGEQDHHPYRAKRMNADGFLEPFVDLGGRKISTNRQELEKCYFLCHNFWVLNMKRSLYAEDGQPPWDFMGNRIKPVFIEHCFDVHEENDLYLCERWLEKNVTDES